MAEDEEGGMTMTAIIISFLLGAAFGVMTTCPIAAGREGDYPDNEYVDTRKTSNMRSDADGQKDS